MLIDPLDGFDRCPDCSAETTVETSWLWDGWLITVVCPSCGVVAEFELGARNEASVRY